MSWKDDFVLTCGDSWGNIHTYDIRSRNVVSIIQLHVQLRDLTWSQSGSHLAATTATVLSIWDSRYNKIFSKFMNNNNNNININNVDDETNYDIFNKFVFRSLVWSRINGDVIACSTNRLNESIRFWSISTGKEVFRPIYSDHLVSNMEWLDNRNELLFSFEGQNYMEIWNVDKNTKTSIMSGNCNDVLYLTQSPDLKHICSLDESSNMLLWHSHSTVPTFHSSLMNQTILSDECIR